VVVVVMVFLLCLWVLIGTHRAPGEAAGATVCPEGRTESCGGAEGQ